MKSGIIFVFLLFLSLAVYPQDFDIKIDAEKDAYYNSLTGPDNGWIYLPAQAFNENGQPDDDADLSANWYSAWDETYLYVYEEVTDDIVSQASGSNYWQNDCFDAKIDADIDATSASEVFCFAMTVYDSADVDPSIYGGVSNLVQTVGGGWTGTGRPTFEDYARKVTETGYVLECRLKWEWVTTTTKGPIVPEVGAVFGFAVQNHDNDSGLPERNASVEWSAAMTDAVWNNCTNMGHIELLADHKIAYIPESMRDPTIVNENPDMYIPKGTAVSDNSAAVKTFSLLQNYPNPFNPETTIKFSIPQSGKVVLSIFDILGNEIKTLVDEVKPAGIYKVKFNGSNLPSGVYLYRIQTGNFVQTKKLLLLK